MTSNLKLYVYMDMDSINVHCTYRHYVHVCYQLLLYERISTYKFTQHATVMLYVIHCSHIKRVVIIPVYIYSCQLVHTTAQESR